MGGVLMRIARNKMRDENVADECFVSDHNTDYSKGQSSSTRNKDKSSSVYHNETVEPSYLSSSIYYGGQENYSPRKKTTESPHYVSI